MRKVLKLQHHRHTGRLLRHHHTSYRGIVVLLVLVGMVLGAAQYTMSVYAEDLVVSAKVSAAIPTVPATVGTPTENQGFTTADVTLTGTCEVLSPAIIVAIYRDGQPIGSTVCTPGGTYQVTVTLLPGINELTVRSVNLTDDFGPDSTPLHVTYTPPVPPASTSPRNTPQSSETPDTETPPEPTAPASDLLVRSEGAFITFGPDKPAVWRGSFTGGTGPYKLVIDWGDGQQETKIIADDAIQELSHKYEIMETHYITFTVTDAEGHTTSYRFAAVTPYVPPKVAAPLLTTNKPNFPKYYAAYTGTVLVGFLIWYETSIHLAKLAFMFKHLHVGK